MRCMKLHCTEELVFGEGACLDSGLGGEEATVHQLADIGEGKPVKVLVLQALHSQGRVSRVKFDEKQQRNSRAASCARRKRCWSAHLSMQLPAGIVVVAGLALGPIYTCEVQNSFLAGHITELAGV